MKFDRRGDTDIDYEKGHVGRFRGEVESKLRDVEHLTALSAL